MIPHRIFGRCGIKIFLFERGQMNAINLQEYIINNPDKIITVLENLGYEDVKDRNTFFQFRNLDGDNPTACCVYKNSLRYENFTRGKNGNLFSLVMDIRGVSFPEALRLISKWIGFRDTSLNVEIVRPFSGFYKQLLTHEDLLDTDLPTYDESYLPDVSAGVSKMFLDDNIALDVQEKFGDRFDHENNAILIPIRNQNGQLVGIKSRTNEKNPEGMRYWATLPFKKSHVVYGLDINYKNIVEKDTVIIVESEKSVQQAYSFDCKICVAAMGHMLSNTQIKIIKSLMTKRIIIAYDEDVEENVIIDQAKQLQFNVPFFQNSVSYIFGGMEKGSKNSPTDNGKEVFQDLIKNHMRKLV